MGKINLTGIRTRAPEDVDKEEIKKKTNEILDELDDLQNLFYAESRHSLLVILQGLDASGKDGAIRDVFGKMNPQGVSVKSFKVPTPEELAHDFLWRVHHHVPEKGMIRIFNRSHYEDILVTRVQGMCDDETAKKRMKKINEFEELLHDHNNTQILKFYMHISAEEQHARLMERMHNPAKMWKYNSGDFEVTKNWDSYMKVYEDAIENCNYIPWIIVPSDQNWYKEYIIASALYRLLRSLDMKYPGLKN